MKRSREQVTTTLVRYREWRIRRKQDDVCRRNEVLARMLTEALPAVYEGPKDYSAKSALLDDEGDLLELTNGAGQGMLMPPPPTSATNGTVHHVHPSKRTSGKVSCSSLALTILLLPMAGSYHSFGSNRRLQYHGNLFSVSSLETERLKAEVMQLKTAEADARIQLSVSQNNEKHARQEAVQLRSRLEQMEARYATMEKLRDVDRNSLSQLEKKYAELMNRKNDVERELMDERKARKEDGGRRLDSVEQQREKERQLEHEVDRLRSEALAREERVTDIEKELHALRKYKENNDVEALNMDLRIMREKMVHLEESLAAENKLKQELFRALGDAKANNAHLQSQLRAFEITSGMPLSVSVARPPSASLGQSEKVSPQQQQPQPQSQQQPQHNIAAYQLPISQAQKMDSNMSTTTHMGVAYGNLYATMEKLRDVDRNSLSQLEKQYAELMNRKNDVERELMDERKARKEDGGRRNSCLRCNCGDLFMFSLDSVEQQREKERQLEHEVDRLRSEALAREERVTDIEKELHALRKYKENNDVEALNMDLRIMREKMVHLEESLAAENKLKQELFRALGDAKANNAHLQSTFYAQHNIAAYQLPISQAQKMDSNMSTTTHMGVAYGNL
ncbi:hypothetical protein OSTOST_05653 [Ostertagia ostertagi]